MERLLVKAWGHGHSASECAQLILTKHRKLFSRNAIIGKVHRMGLTGRGHTSIRNANGRNRRGGQKAPAFGYKNRQKSRAAKAMAAMEKTQSVCVEPTTYDRNVKGKALLELKDHGECKWPIGDPKHADFKFCAEKSLPGLPYCMHHAKRAYPITEVKKVRTEIKHVELVEA